MSYAFKLSLLQAVSDWQRSSTEKRAHALKSECASLPDEFRSCRLVCYRQIALPSGGVWDLIGENRLTEKISSWTVDSEVAKAFKGGVPPDGQGYQGTIMYLFPPPGSVVVNIRRLYETPEFALAMKRNCSSIIGYYDGAGKYWNSQSEVVLEIEAVTQADVFSLGGHSSPMDDLISLAANVVYRREATDAERENLLLKASEAGIIPGPRWLNMDATRRVLERTKPRAAALAEAKRLQTASAANP